MNLEEIKKMEPEEIHKYVYEIAHNLSKMSDKNIVGIHWQLGDDYFVVKIYLSFIYKNLYNYKKLIEAIEKTLIEDEYHIIHLDFYDTYVEIQIQLVGEDS